MPESERERPKQNLVRLIRGLFRAAKTLADSNGRSLFPSGKTARGSTTQVMIALGINSADFSHWSKGGKKKHDGFELAETKRLIRIFDMQMTNDTKRKAIFGLWTNKFSKEAKLAAQELTAFANILEGIRIAKGETVTATVIHSAAGSVIKGTALSDRARDAYWLYRDRQKRNPLVNIARSYYEKCALSDFSVITRPGWIPKRPIPLTDIDKTLQRFWIPNGPELRLPSPTLLGDDTYSAFIARVNPKVKQEDKFCYRLLDVQLDGSNFELTFCPSNYLAFVSSCDLLGFELAEWFIRNQTESATLAPRTDGSDLVLRGPPEAIFDLGTRSACPATSAILLLLNTEKGDLFYMQKRESDELLDSPGGWHVAPSGQFQPDTWEDLNHARDFSITRTVMREFAEEFLGIKEVEKEITIPYDFYDESKMVPFVSGLNTGAVQLYFMGMGFDPLPTKPGFYIALVIDAARMAVDPSKFLPNWEGRHGPVPLSELENWSRNPNVIPDGATCLRLAFRHLNILRSLNKLA